MKKDNQKLKRTIIIGLLLTTLVLVLITSLQVSNKTSQIEIVFRDTITSLKNNLIDEPINNVKKIIDDYGSLKDVQKENEILRAQINESLALEAQVDVLKQENQELLELNKIETNKLDYTMVNANVIGRNYDTWDNFLIIDKGKKNGIEVDMAVITGKGLVGKVVETTDITAKIKLLTTEDNSNPVSSSILIDNKSYNALINGYDSDKGLLKMQVFDAFTPVKVGQDVVTSGLGGVFPKGIAIGKVVDINDFGNGVENLVYVKPYAEFSSINYVGVVKRKANVITND